MEKAEKKVTSAKVTEYEPDLSWNLWKVPPKGKDPGVPLEPEKRVKVEITWPDLETFEGLIGHESTFASFHALTRRCATRITNFPVGGELVETGADLVAVRVGRINKARELSINIGSFIFRESLLDEEEEKN
ncbi:MAG: hypothetical protein AAGU26_10525 [bacterium]